jgi:hypothetical protein
MGPLGLKPRTNRLKVQTIPTVRSRLYRGATVRKAITMNEQRVLAVYLHVRSGYRG